jgi:anti-sigma B factor antagonist
MEPLTISRTASGDWSVVTVAGEVDVATSPALSQALADELVEGVRLAVDLSGVTFLDSTGLGVLVHALNGVVDAGGELRLVVTDPNVLKVFEVTSLDDVFVLCPSLETALD